MADRHLIRLARRTAANPRSATLFATNRKKMIEIADALGGKLAETIRLRAQGKDNQSIANELGVPKSTVDKHLSAANCLLRHYELTRRLPRKDRPQPQSVDRAKETVTRLFPSLGSRQKLFFINAIAHGLENRVPPNSTEISALRRAMRITPGNFPREIYATLRPKLSVAEQIEEIRPQLEIAAKRGDSTAQLLLSRPSHHLQTMEEGAGVVARNPDLFLGTNYQAKIIQGINPLSLRTRKSLVDALAKRKERIGIVMQLHMNGKSRRQISKQIGRKEAEVIRLIAIGSHFVFGIPPTTNRMLVEYLELRRQHPAIAIMAERLKPREKTIVIE
ncbi:MAG: hypothetical protein V1644_01695 [Candidatus Micrarchaeota archaeon]